ncbi:hypothetical protein EAI_08663 [Harpegnathos saltator]|uniref:Uncharacterized protein n=1 Tax=Harpegnathos saltator TaxID=610380 RepID=E2BCS6_HARSA|nr:hypothetical protein EAI_08663 [Harpegnathos saltator]
MNENFSVTLWYLLNNSTWRMVKRHWFTRVTMFLRLRSRLYFTCAKRGHKAKALKERRKRLLCETTVVRGGTVAQRHFSSLRQINKDVLEALLRGTSVLYELPMSTLRWELLPGPRSVRTMELKSGVGYMVGVMGLYERDPE